MCPLTARAAPSVPFLGVLDNTEDTVLGHRAITTALAYGIDPVLAVEVLKCESGFNHEGLYGDGGRAYGVAQFHKGTFEWFKKDAGRPDLEYTSATDQIELFAWAVKNGRASHWTCWRDIVHEHS